MGAGGCLPTCWKSLNEVGPVQDRGVGEAGAAAHLGLRARGWSGRGGGRPDRGVGVARAPILLPLDTGRRQSLWAPAEEAAFGVGLSCSASSVVQTGEGTRAPTLGAHAIGQHGQRLRFPPSGRASIPRLLVAWTFWREEQGWGGWARSPGGHFP